MVGQVGGLQVEEDARTRVFLSYSRKDSGLVGRIAEALMAAGFLADFDQASHDPHNVSAGISAEDEWWKRLQEMIASADAMVFLVSPDSASSKVCDEEIAYARALGKRIIAVLARPVDFAKAPPRLSALNVRIDFSDGGPGFEAALGALTSALEMNVVWHREARKYLARVQEWDSEGRPKSQLLREGAVEEAERWALARPRNEPEPGELFLAWIAASRAQIRRDAEVRAFWRRVTAVFVLTTLVATVVGAWFVVNGQRNLGRSESLMLARTADQFSNDGDHLRALQMAILASRNSFLSPTSDEAKAAFAKAAQALRLVSAIDIVTEPDGTPAMIAGLVPLADDTRVLVLDHYGRVSLWDAVDGAQLVAPIDAGVWSPPGIHVDAGRRRALVVWSSMAYLIDAAEGTAREVARPAESLPAGLSIADITPDGAAFLLRDAAEQTISVYDTVSGERRFTLEAETPVREARFELGGAAISTREARSYRLWSGADGAPAQSLTDLVDPGIAGAQDGVHLSPDGRFIIADAAPGKAEVFDMATGNLIAELTGHTDYLSEAVFVPGRDRVLFWDSAGSLHLYSASSFARIGAPVKTADRLSPEYVSADAGLFLTRSYLGGVAAWSLETGAQMTGPAAADADGETVAYDGARFAPGSNFLIAWDGRRIMSVPADGSGGDPVQFLDEHPGFIQDVVVSPDGRSFLTYSSEAQARQWDMLTGYPIGGPWPAMLTGAGTGYSEDGAKILTAREDRAWIWTARDHGVAGARTLADGTPVARSYLSPGGAYQVAVSASGRAELRRARTGEVYGREILMGEFHKSGLAFDPSGKRLAVWYEASVQMINLETGEAEEGLIDTGVPVRDAVFNADGTRLVTQDTDQNVRVWDPLTLAAVGAPRLFETGMMPPMSPDGTRMLVWRGLTAELVDLASGQAVSGEMAHALINDPGQEEPALSGAAFSADGARLVTWSSDELRIWDGQTGALLAGPVVDGGGPYAAAISADGTRALAIYLGFARVYDTANGEPAGPEFASGTEGRSGSLSADGRLAVTWGDDGQMHLWNTATGARIGNPAEIGILDQEVQFSADGRRMLAAEAMGTFRILDTVTGDVVARWELSNTAPGYVWTADGAQVLSHSHDGEVRVWDTGFASETDASPERIAAACASKLRGTGSPGSGGVAFVRTLDDTGVFRAPILRGREGEDVCTAPPVPWWETAAGAVFGWMFR